MYSIGWFSTGRDKAARDLLAVTVEAIKKGELGANIDFVFCSREPGESAESDMFINQVKTYGIPLVCYSYQKFKANVGSYASVPGAFPEWRLSYDRKVMEKLRDFNPALCVLAGYVLIIGPEMCARLTMVNLHPAAPGGPTGTWQEVIWQIIEQQSQQSGVMMHLVAPELDRGPVVSYCTFSICGGKFTDSWEHIRGTSLLDIKEKEGERNILFQTIRGEGLKREFPLIIATIKAFSEGKVRIAAGKVLDAHGNIIPGCNLTREIERAIATHG
jgi:phosphoribosylglycinamide formyltransferase 1